MKFLSGFKKFSDNKWQPMSIHHMPFDSKYGLGKAKEELEKEGILVDSIPEPLQIDGKTPVMYWNPTDIKIFYEYEDIPKSKEGLQQELNAKLLKDSANIKIELDVQKQFNANLLLKIAQLGGDLNA